MVTLVTEQSQLSISFPPSPICNLPAKHTCFKKRGAWYCIRKGPSAQTTFPPAVAPLRLPLQHTAEGVRASLIPSSPT